MSQHSSCRIALSDSGGSLAQQRECFALLNLGLVESVSCGVLTPMEAVRLFYHADNCLYVQKRLRQKEASEVMSRGAQLPDLFDGLTAEEAQHEVHHEIETIRRLCVTILEKNRAASAANRVAA